MHITTKIVLLLAFVASVATGRSQQRYLYIYDHTTMTTDSMPVTEALSWVTASTPWFAGTIAGRSDLPDQMPPPEQLMGDMSRMRPARDYVNVAHYPARAVSSLRIKRDDVWRASCSATLVGPKWALTSAHCLYGSSDPIVHKHWDYRVYPAWDDSASQTIVPFARVIRTYTVRTPDRGPLSNDVALLELEAPIGRDLGWIGLLTFPNDDFIENVVAHRLSYPASQDLFDTNRIFDGDTMWYRYGTIRRSGSYLYSDGAIGIPGESGSSVILAREGGYHATATLSYAYGMPSAQLDSTTFEHFARIILPTIASVDDGQGADMPPNSDEISVYRYTLHGEIVNGEAPLPSGVYLEVTTFHGNRTTRLINVVR